MNQKRVRGKIDWMITLVPLAIVVALCILFFLVPEQSNAVLSQIRFFFGDTFGTYYLVIGLEFPIVKDTTPNMMNPRLYTTSYNKP